MAGRKNDTGALGEAAARALHHAGLLAALFVTPIVWGRFDAFSAAIVLACLTLSAAGLLLSREARLLPTGRPWSTFPLALVAFILISIISYFTSISKFASAVELIRLLAGALAFWLALHFSRTAFPAMKAPVPENKPNKKAKRRSKGKARAEHRIQWQSPQTLFFVLRAALFVVLSVTGLLLHDWRSYYVHTPRPLFILIAIGLAVTTWLIWKKPDFAGLIDVAIIAAAVVAANGIYDWLFAYLFLDNKTWQPFATFVNPNSLAGFLGLALFIALGVIGKVLDKEARNYRAYLPAIIAGLLVAVCLLPTNSKGTWLSVYFAGVVFIAVSISIVCASRPKRILLIALLLFGLLIAPMGLVFVHPTAKAKATSALSLQNTSNMVRYLTWKATANMARDHPWLGVGPGAFEYSFGSYAIAGYTRRAHQNYLEVFSEVGWPGLAAFIWLFAAAFIGVGRSVKGASSRSDKLVAAGAFCALLVMALHSLLDYDWFIGANLIYFFLAAAVGLCAANSTAEEKAGSRSPKLIWRAITLGILLLVCGKALFIGSAERYFRAAENASLRQDYWRTAAHLRTAIRLAPNYARAHWELAKYSSPQERIPLLNKAISLESTYPAYRLTLGSAKEAEGDFEGALKAYTEATVLSPQYLKAWIYRAQINLVMGRPRQTAENYQQIIQVQRGPVGLYPAIDYEVKTEYADAHYGLAVALLLEVLENDAQTALEHLNEALAIIDEYDRAGIEFERQLRVIGRGEAGLEERLAFLRAKCNYRIARILAAQDKTTKAREMLLKAQEVVPNIAEVIAEENRVWRK